MPVGNHGLQISGVLAVQLGKSMLPWGARTAKAADPEVSRTEWQG